MKDDEMKWVPLFELHEEGFPYLIWELTDPSEIFIVTNIDDVDFDAFTTHAVAMSVRKYFMFGYQPEIDDVIQNCFPQKRQK